MNLQHIAFKIFAESEISDWEQFINVFHGWVAAQSMPEMMIDVADYRHVPQGPGVVMVGHAADYYMDNVAGKPGLRFVCKVDKEGSNADRIKHAVTSASAACARLESEVSGMKFSRTDFELTVNDRGVAPNTGDTRSFLESELPAILKDALGSDVEIEIQQDERKLAGASIKVASPIELAAA